MHLRRFAFAGFSFVLAACGGGIDVRSDYDPGTDFSAYQTFAVLDEAEGGGDVSQFTDQRIKNSIVTVLTERGWRMVDTADEADATVGYQFTTDDRVSYQTVDTGWGGYGYGYGGWYGGWGGGMSTSTTTEQHYSVGTLVIAVFDQDRKEMIYVSTGSKTLDDRNLSPDEAQMRFDEGVRTILRDFPPGGGS